MISIAPASHASVIEIASELRELDREELLAVSASDAINPQVLAHCVMAFSTMSFVASDDELGPVSCWGVTRLWPGVGNAYAIGTDDWGRALLPMTKHIRGFMIPTLLDFGFHRIECRSLASRQDVGRWLRLLGAEPENVLRGSGKRGEDFVLYRWLAHEQHRASGKRAGPEHRQPAAR